MSRQYSPRELVLRLREDYTKHCRVLFGSYCEVHDEPDPSNLMQPRTHLANALGPSGNLQGSVNFYSLDTGFVLRRRNLFTALPTPTPESIIKKVNAIGKKKKQEK